ncbi:MAG: cysteine synthase A [Bacillota bacterium]|nr:MAG: cysteine synthase A [Bacillota bacterium]
MNIYGGVEELIGRTPLLELKKIAAANGLKARVFAKLECFNPAGSAKDRIALFMLNDAEKRGALSRGGTVVEPTSGNTGVGLAMLCAARGYKLILIMPENMSEERRKLLKAYGAELVLTPAAEGMAGAIARAEGIAKERGAFLAGQFENPANPLTHYLTTGREIYEDADGKIDIFVAGVGTGGTLSGCAKFLKEKNPAVRAVAVEPAASPVLSGGKKGAHGLQGIGAGFVPKNLDMSLVDEIVRVTEEEAFFCARELAKTEGVLTGISSGAALFAAKTLAMRAENEGKNIAVVLPDTGARYFSAKLFD